MPESGPYSPIGRARSNRAAGSHFPPESLSPPSSTVPPIGSDRSLDESFYVRYVYAVTSGFSAMKIISYRRQWIEALWGGTKRASLLI